MRFWWLSLLLACAPAQQNDLAVQLESSNFRVGKRLIVLQISYQNKPLENAVVTVRGDMTHAGMSPVQQVARAEKGGRYLLSNFDFTMSGDWVLSISAKTTAKTLLGEVKLGVNP